MTDKIEAYFKDTKGKLPDATTIWHASSDILESLFGKFKQISSPNKLHGVTPFVLSLCVYTNFDEHTKDMANQIKFALENVFMTDLKEWKQANLIDNQVVCQLKMKNLEDQLSTGGFVRVHKSFLVPINKISQIEGNKIMIDTHKIPIGDNFKDTLFLTLKDKILL